MKRIDGLGPRPDRYPAFTRELLAEAEDNELKFIVEEAAKDLKTPIAMVSLVMEHIQFFKAHFGLPDDLVKLGGTDRDISFCQFVVESEEPFEVQDAKNDDRVPKTMVEEYGVQAYLGIPITANDVVVGSLCVLDTKPRKFSVKERDQLKKLANLVNKRLAVITEKRSRSSTLLERTTYPALEEIKKVIQPMKSALSASYMASVEINTFIKLAEMGLRGRGGSLEEQRIALSKAKDALDIFQNNLYNMEASVDDAEDSIGALEHVFLPARTTLLSEIAISGRELARYNLAKSGGAFLPDLQYDPLVSIPRPMGVSLIATTLSMIANELINSNQHEKLRLDSDAQGAFVAFIIRSEKLSLEQLGNITIEQRKYVEEDPAVDVRVVDQTIQLLFSIVQLRK